MQDSGGVRALARVPLAGADAVQFAYGDEFVVVSGDYAYFDDTNGIA